MAADIMLCCVPPAERTQRIHSQKIDKHLQKQKLQLKRTVKILLLGSGESGKSTFLKQMRIIHGVDFEEDQVQEFKTTIYSNIVKGMKVLVDATSKLEIPWEDKANESHGQIVYAYDNNVKLDETTFSKYVPALDSLWKDGAIIKAYERRREFQLGDSVRYFLDILDKVKQRSYIPTTADILMARKPTKGIYEIVIDVRGIPFKFVDVGGQRSQRQKWFQCFDNVTSILFLCSSSEFDQVLMEDRQTNRLVESINIFETIVNNKCFETVSIILFLNKTDLLRDKVRKISIKRYFPEFQGDPHRLEDVQNFMLHMFDVRRRDPIRMKPLFHHFTTAIDTDNIKFVFQAVKDIILQKNLTSLMLS